MRTPRLARLDDRSGDNGFTLIELLIVIVILGILATVVVFAVGGISDRGTASACSSELRILTTAEETHGAQFSGTYADEAGLVAAQLLRSESELYDVTLELDGSFAIAPVSGSGCTGGIAAAATVPTTLPPPGPLNPTPISFGSIPAWQYGATGADEVVVFGRSEGEYDFRVTVNEGPPTSRRVTFINLDLMVDDGDVDYVLSRSRSNGISAWAIYPDDDTSTMVNTSGGTWPSVDSYLVTAVGGDPYHMLDATGFDLTDLLTMIG